jgi:histidine ammonia-lyase
MMVLSVEMPFTRQLRFSSIQAMGPQGILELSGQPLKIEEIASVAHRKRKVAVAKDAWRKVNASRSIVEGVITSGETTYGINTGFGKLADVRIADEDLKALQHNLVRSHASGVGEALPEPETRAMLLLRANVLAKGHSGVRPVVIETLLSLLNHEIHPVVPSRGSVGASGDLAPLAHLALALMGEGEVFYQGKRTRACCALKEEGISPLALEAKEGLALLNGTQAMAAVGALALDRAQRVTLLFDLAGAMSLEALRGTPTPFDERIHAVRPHSGQVQAAAHLRYLLQDSEIRESHRHNDPRVQDAYCLRCMPQVHGAARGVLAHVREVIETEAGSATDNPLIFLDENGIVSGGTILSGGNFHGAPLALALDYAAIALTDLMSISERRIDRLINPDINEGLPPFLSDTPGVSSGLMIAHVAAAALLNEAKVLAHPASVDSVPTSGGKEDHVSMGMTSALKLRQIVENAERVLAIEMMTAAQGLDYRLPLKPAREVAKAKAVVRNCVPHLKEDRVLSGDIEKLTAEIQSGTFDVWRN